MTALTYETAAAQIAAAFQDHYGPPPEFPLPAAEEPVEPAAEDAAVQEAARTEWTLLNAAIGRNQAFHRDFLRSAPSFDAVLRGEAGDYPREVLQGLLTRLKTLPEFISTPEHADHFIKRVHAFAREDLDQYDLTPAELHDTAALTDAQLSDAERMREPNAFESDERAAAAAETMKATVAQAHGASVEELTRVEAGMWAAKDTRVTGPEDHGDAVHTPGVAYGEDPWGLGTEQAAAQYENELNAWTAEQEALAKLSESDHIDALAAAAPDEKMYAAFKADRHREAQQRIGGA